MLSEEKVEALRAKVAEWGKAKKVPHNIQVMILEMGRENPRSQEEKQKICEKHLWADAVIRWYDNFIEYLESLNPEPEEEPTDYLLALKTARDLLDKVIGSMENGQ